MSYVGGQGPLDLNYKNMTVVGECVRATVPSAVEGWEQLGSCNAAGDQFAFAVEYNFETERPDIGWPMYVGLGFGVQLALTSLGVNRPDYDITANLRLSDNVDSRRRICREVGFRIRNLIVDINRDNRDKIQLIDPNHIRNIDRNADLRSMKSAAETTVFRASTYYGFLRMAKAVAEWELEHPDMAMAASMPHPGVQ